MRRIIRYIFGTTVTLGCLAYAYAQGLGTWPETVALLGALGIAATVGFGPEVGGGLQIELPAGAGVGFGDDEDEGQS